MNQREFHIERDHTYPTTGAVRWIVAHAARYPWLVPAMIAAAVVNNYAYGNVQIYIGRGFDIITAPRWTLQSLAVVAVIIAVSAVVQGLTGLARNFAVELLAQRIERDSRAELYHALLGKSQTFHGRRRLGDIMARAGNDVRALNMMFSPGIMLIVDSSLALMVPFVMILFIDARLGIVPALFTALLIWTVVDYNARLKPVSIAQREQFGAMNSGLAEALGAIEIVKGNVQEEYERRKFLGDARLFRDYFVQQGIIQAKYWPMLAFAVCWGLAFLHAMLLWRSDAITLGQAVSFLGLFGTFRFATFISIFSFNLVPMGVAAADRILELSNYRTELDQNAGGYAAPIRGRIEFRDVSFGFEDKPVLQRISFAVEPGETVAIVGQTGAGKSTLTRLVNRIFDVSEGQVLVDGIDVREWDLSALRRGISTIEQDLFLFSLSVRDNIAFGAPDASTEQIEAAARAAQAHDFISVFQDGYATQIGERGVMLSGGQKQRIAIARAFLTDPRILILDDSTSAIDSRTEDEIQSAMRGIARNRTTLLITHRLSQIRRADRVLVLRGGRLVDSGSHHQLIERCADYRRIFAFV